MSDGDFYKNCWYKLKMCLINMGNRAILDLMSTIECEEMNLDPKKYEVFTVGKPLVKKPTKNVE